MKSPSKRQLFVASLVILAGVCGGTWLMKTPILRSRIEGFTSRLQRMGLGTQLGVLRWEGWWTAHIEHLKITGADNAQLTLEDIVVHLEPAFSWRGQDWIDAIGVGNITLQSPKVHGRASLQALNAGSGWGIALHDLHASHPAFGNNELQLGELAGWCRVETADDRLTLRPGSCFKWGHAWIAASGHWESATKNFALKTILPLQPAQTWIDPMATLAPDWLGGMQMRGAVQGHLDLSLNLDSLDALHLDGGLDGQGIAVTQYGPAHLDSLKIVAQNPAFVKMEALPQYLVQAVVLSEDAGFWGHEGFDKEILRLALAEDIAAGKFLRGGGTIPMQLVRNVFLHHGKQLDRKLAEATLTWLAEEQHLLTKSEQMTAYLNLIEWGDGIHGIQQAASHYFGKQPQNLDVNEAIFLACIIPNPKHAGQLLEADGSLGPYAQDYFDSMRWMLYEGDWIGEEWLDAPYPKWVGRI